jgi:acetyl esterase
MDMTRIEARLDPDAAKLLQAMRTAKIPRMERLTPVAARALIAELRARAKTTPPQVDEVRDLAAPGPAGEIKLRLYRPKPTEGPGPCLVFFHGGGWVVGGVDTHDVLCRQFANACGFAVIAVGYRLAPEHKFPAGLDDACAGFRWIVEQAGALGLDPQRIAVGGDSAGGNLAAVIALMARDGALPRVRAQALLYPVTDLRLKHPSMAMDIDGLILNGPTMAWFRDHYLSRPDEQADWRASPLLAASLAGVAPCHIVTAAADPLCDEGLAYAARLIEAGARVTHQHHPGQMHGFFTGLPNSPVQAGALASLAATLRAELFAA